MPGLSEGGSPAKIVSESGFSSPSHAELGSASHEIRYFETLKQPMKQVQGMVQGDRYRLFYETIKINIAKSSMQNEKDFW
jgi:hypothetical protein